MDVSRVLASAGTRLTNRLVAYHDHCDIVGGAARQRQIDERVTGMLRSAVRYLLEDFIVLDMRGQPVTAQDERVRRLQHTILDLQLGIGMHPDRARYDVPPRPPARFRGTEPSLLDQFLHFGMIARLQFDPA